MRSSNLKSWCFLGALTAIGCAGDDGGGGGASSSGTVEVTISGEELASDGFLFPSGSEVAFADGWEVTFQHVLVTVGNVTLSANPDEVPSDQSQTGAVVAGAAGPWAVDLHQPGGVAGVGGEGRAFPITRFENQNRNANRAFDPAERYAFGFELVRASADAELVNFAGDATAEAAYGEMVTNGHSVMIVGTATFVGTGCEVADDGYDFDGLPAVVDFRLGFATPTSHLNCQNQENQGEPFDGEEFQRGIPILSNRASAAQITLHLDHPFFSDVEHEPALFFTQMAARLRGEPEGTPLTTEHFAGVDPTAFTDAEGTPLPWRVCDGSALPPNPQMSFEVGELNVDPTAEPAQALRDYRDFVHYVQSAQGHLNGGEGLCFVRRNYASPQ